MNQKLREKIMESLSSVLPITIIMLVLSTLVVPMNVGTVVLFLAGAIMLVVGMGLFQLGAEIAMTPLGEGIGTQLFKKPKLWLVMLISFAVGVVITVAEPDLQVLASQVPSIPNNILIWTVSLGVGVMLMVAILRIMFRVKLSNILLILYGMLFLVSIFIPDNFTAVAFDSGGVTTGPITVPFIMAMGVGIASIRSDKNASDDSFGLVAICSVGPILAVMLLGMFYNPSEAVFSPVDIASITTMQDVLRELAQELPHYAWEVFVSLLPVLAVFLIFELLTRRFHKRQFIRAVVGFVYTYVGLVLFLCGANVGFAPVGSLLGSDLAGTAWSWMLIPIGMVVGYYIVKAEPAVHVLNRQVEDVTEGAIPGKAMNLCLSIGVAVSVGLSMLRVLTGLSIYWILVPGYLIAIVLSRIVPKIFVGIAFDAGGVASGPMTTTFLLPLAMGACNAVGGNVMTDAFGVVAMVAMTPLIAIQIMGLIYMWKQKNLVEPEDVVDDDVLLAHAQDADEDDEILLEPEIDAGDDEILDL